MEDRAIFAELDAPLRLAEDRALEVGVDKIGANGSMRGLFHRELAVPLRQGAPRREKAIEVAA